MTPSELKTQFAAHFGGDGRIIVVRAPGRVNLIGEHTDYNDGFVCPMAIEPAILLAARARTDNLVHAKTTLYPEQTVEFRLDQPITKAEPFWGNYVRGSAAQLLNAGIPLVGMDVLIANTLPPGGGLSSSAALEVGTIRTLLSLAGEELDNTRVALLGQKAEHDYADTPCGIMDQSIVAGGRSGHAMLLDCRDNSKTFIPVNAHDLKVVIVNSMAPHELSGGEYRERLEQCEAGVAHFQKKGLKIKALRDVTMEQVLAAKSGLDDVVFRRCRHVVGEIARCTAFGEHLKREHYEAAGKLMVESHNSLRDDYEVSTDELDFLAAHALTLKGVYGARMTGGGFGGCTVSLVQPRYADDFARDIAAAYEKQTKIKPVVFATSATDGARVVE